jgi:hypothetical protein
MSDDDQLSMIHREIYNSVAGALRGPLADVVAPPSEAVIAIANTAAHIAHLSGVDWARVVASTLPAAGADEEHAVNLVRAAHAAKRGIARPAPHDHRS